MSNQSPKGRWSGLFNDEMNFRQQVAAAVHVDSDIELVSIPGLEDDHSYVEIIVGDIPGWDEPLWATDDRWLYLRRPEGIWKTELPLLHLGRKGVIYQRRGNSEIKFGGTQMGQNFNGKSTWHFCRKPTSPMELDFPCGRDSDGFELGPMLLDACSGQPGMLTLSAGPAFGTPPKSWRFEQRRLVATGQDGRVVVFPIPESFEIESIAKAGKLCLRFEVLTHAWMEPFDAQVVV